MAVSHVFFFWGLAFLSRWLLTFLIMSFWYEFYVLCSFVSLVRNHGSTIFMMLFCLCTLCYCTNKGRGERSSFIERALFSLGQNHDVCVLRLHGLTALCLLPGDDSAICRQSEYVILSANISILWQWVIMYNNLLPLSIKLIKWKKKNA